MQFSDHISGLTPADPNTFEMNDVLDILSVRFHAAIDHCGYCLSTQLTLTTCVVDNRMPLNQLRYLYLPFQSFFPLESIQSKFWAAWEPKRNLAGTLHTVVDQQHSIISVILSVVSLITLYSINALQFTSIWRSTATCAAALGLPNLNYIQFQFDCIEFPQTLFLGWVGRRDNYHI